MKTPKNYNARWSRGASDIGNVSFTARNDNEAKRKADRLADQIGLPNTPRTLSRGFTTIESLTTGKTNP